MNEIRPFYNDDFGEIRTLMLDGEPWFIAKDLAAALGYKRTDVMYRIIDEDDRREINPQTLVNTGFHSNSAYVENNPNIKRMVLINENGMYDAIFGSNLPNARRFKRWVTSEVLPSIRKNGGYIVGQETLTDDELIARALQVANNKIQQRNALIEQQRRAINELEPKAAIIDAIATSNDSVRVRDFAHILKQAGYDTGEKRLYKWFRDNGYICIRGTKPTQKALNLGLFEISLYTIMVGETKQIKTTTLVTGKGQIYFMKKLLKLEDY